MIETRTTEIAALAEFEGFTDKFWTGLGMLTFNGSSYTGLGQVLSVQNSPIVIGEPAARAQITLDISQTNLRQTLMQDHGPIKITLRWIFSWDVGKTWKLIGRTYSGKLSNPVIKNLTYTVDIESLLGDIHVVEVEYWSDEDQRRRFPNDLGLQKMRELSQEGIAGIRFPA